jgi:arylformamidase
MKSIWNLKLGFIGVDSRSFAVNNSVFFMKAILSLFSVIALLPVASAQEHVVYAEPAGPLHTLDVYAMPKEKNAPVMFWIHGGGWETGDKSDVAQKPQFFVERGFVFVSINYRLLPKWR